MEAPVKVNASALKGLRVGLGYDVHAFAADRKLILGGVEIPHHQGLDGHSDADVLLHAISDALLGATRLGDIGKLFPDTDPAYKGANSLKLLEEVASLVKREGFEILDIDCVIAAQAPKLSPYRNEMRENVARACGMAVENVGIKATTTEHLGFEGREEGISAQAVALVCRCC
jgi:2-C-methyl-D-erythritol 2,4-cyclodiphosphate synthase